MSFASGVCRSIRKQRANTIEEGDEVDQGRPISARDVQRGELLKASFARDADTAEGVSRTFEILLNEAQ
jgi:hypothetical protein